MMLSIGQFPARCRIMLVIFAVWGTAAHAVGLGQLQVRSWLGQPLQALAPLLGERPDTLDNLCVKAKLESSEGDFVAPLQAILIHEPQTGLRLSSSQTAAEPAMAVSVSVGCGMPVKRTYQVLLDPPLTAASPLAPPQPEPEPPARSHAALQIARHMPARPKQAARTSRPVLRLSNPEPEANFDLKLSSSLSEPAFAGDPQKSREIHAAHTRFAALLKGEDPLHDAEVQARSARERLQILAAEIDLLKERNRIDQSKLDELQKKPDLFPWVAALAALLFVSMAALIRLASRSKAAPRRNIDFVERRFEPRSARAPAAPLDFRAEGRNGNYPFHAVPSGAPADSLPAAGDRIEITKAEEISDVLQEVEFWALLNDRARVLEILEPLAEVEQPDSPAPWLYLLDAYREMREQAKYEALRERFARVFNVSISRWEEWDKQETLRSLEDFPHLLAQICDRWQRPGLVDFLESLLLDDRDGTREGFDLPVYRELMMLIGMARELRKAPAAAAA